MVTPIGRLESGQLRPLRPGPPLGDTIGVIEYYETWKDVSRLNW